MGYSGCCIDDEPSSPPGSAPRPINTTINLRKQSSKYLMAMPQTSWSTASRFSKPEDAAELRAIFEYDMENDEDTQEITMNKSSTTLLAVKSKLHKHLSRESASSKRRSGSTVGNSAEELIRRKELREARNSRIKQELSNDRTYDEDAKSISTLATIPTASGLVSYVQTAGGYTVMPPEPDWPPGLSDAGLPIAYSTTDPPFGLATENKEYPYGLSNNGHSTSPGASPARKRSPSSATYCYRFDEVIEIAEGGPLDSQIPPSPILQPRRLPSIDALAIRRTSWRLSFGTEQRAGRLRALSRDHSQSLEPPPAPRAPQVNPAELTELQHQCSQRPLDPNTQFAIEFKEPERLSPNNELHTDKENLGQFDRSGQSPPSLHLHQMDISKRLYSRGMFSYASSPQLSSCNSRGSDHYIYSPMYQKTDDGSRRTRHMSMSSVTEPERPAMRREILCRNTSASPLPAKSMVYTNLYGSDANLESLILSQKARKKSQSERIECLQTQIVHGALPLGSHPLNTDRKDLTVASNKTDIHHRGHQSRWDPFVNTRFEDDSAQGQSRSKSHAGRSQVDPEGDSPIIFNIFPNLGLPRIARLSSHTFDGNKDRCDTRSPHLTQQLASREEASRLSLSLSQPMSTAPNSGDRARKSCNLNNEDISGTSFEDTAKMWSRAIRASRGEDLQQMHDEKSSPVKDSASGFHGRKRRSRIWPWTVNDKKEISTLELGEREPQPQPSDAGLGSETNRVDNFQQTSSSDPQLNTLNDRPDQCTKTAIEGPVIVKSWMQNRAVTPPLSWAKYTSHTRAERNESAGHDDRVDTRDFAIRSIHDGVTEWQVGPERQLHYHHREKIHRYRLPHKIRMKFRTSFDKIRASKNTWSSGTYGRRSSTSIGGELEYPELEILPLEGGATPQLQELELEVAAAMRREERIKRMMTFSDGSMDPDIGGYTTLFDFGEGANLSLTDRRIHHDFIVSGVATGDHDTLALKQAFPMKLGNGVVQ